MNWQSVCRRRRTRRCGSPCRDTLSGDPCPYDRVLATRLGAAAAEAILDGKYGCMMGVSNDKIIHVPLAEVAGKLKYVDPDSEIIQEAKLTGISFGDK